MEKQTGEYSEYSYEEIMNLVKHKKPLAEVIEHIFETNHDVCVWNTKWNWDVEANAVAFENLDLISDGYDVDEYGAWIAGNLEVEYEKLLQYTYYIDEDGDPSEFVSGEHDGFNWDRVKLKDGRFVIIEDNCDYISIHLVDPEKITDGTLNLIFDIW